MARPVPNYKTLEVMLVERGKTYETITEATPEEFWCIWYLFIGKAIIGIAMGICITIVTVLVLGCLYECCCKEHQDF